MEKSDRVDRCIRGRHIATLALRLEGIRAWQGRAELNDEVDGILSDRAIKVRIDGLGASEFAGPPLAFATFIADEKENWSRVVKRVETNPD
jgi:hypothetical protein